MHTYQHQKHDERQQFQVFATVHVVLLHCGLLETLQAAGGCLVGTELHHRWE